MSNLKKAKNLIKNPSATLGELESLAAEMTASLIRNSSNFDAQTKQDYVNVIARLGSLASSRKSTGGFNKLLTKKNNKFSKKANFSEEESFSNQNNSLIVPRNLEQKYLLSEHFPYDSSKGDYVWLDYVGMKSLLNSKGRIVLPSRIEIVLTNNTPELFIGDLRIIERKQISEYKSVLEAEPFINIERVKALYEFYLANKDYRPISKGELFWTPFKPQKAHTPKEQRLSNKNYSMPSSKANDHFVKIKGFVVFVSGIDEKILKDNDIFDFVYTGTNSSQKSGRGIYAPDSLRARITENIDDYLSL